MHYQLSYNQLFPSNKHDKFNISFESGKNQPNLYITNLDTIDTKKEELQQQLLLDQLPEVQENTFLNKDNYYWLKIKHANCQYIIS